MAILWQSGGKSGGKPGGKLGGKSDGKFRGNLVERCGSATGQGLTASMYRCDFFVCPLFNPFRFQSTLAPKPD